MAAIGTGWAEDAWIEAGWVSAAWDDTIPVVTPTEIIIRRLNIVTGVSLSANTITGISIDMNITTSIEL